MALVILAKCFVRPDGKTWTPCLGRLLLNWLVDAIVRTQPMCRSVNVGAHPENEIALSLYRSAGFRDTGRMSGIEPELTLDLVRA